MNLTGINYPNVAAPINYYYNHYYLKFYIFMNIVGGGDEIFMF